MIKIAFAGKGGSGKSSISGTFARVVARQGKPVLALDSDPVPGMPYALGIPVDDSPTPDDVVVEGPEDGPRWVLRPGLDAEQFIERYAAVGPGGVRYLQFGNTWGHVSTLQRAQFAWSQVVKEMDPTAWNVVGDLPGGTRQAMFGWAKYANLMAIVVEPNPKSIHVGRRLRNISKAEWAPANVVVVANKVEIPSDAERIQEQLDLPVIGVVPADASVTAADKLACAPLDYSAGPFVEAIEALVATVEEAYDDEATTVQHRSA
ncbi:MAG: ArsA-related P-loop ATPase [Acidimicrobiia bacterium]|nr:ArsA-related P-loop ATPase [Acidimicrobiia bacterium]